MINELDTSRVCMYVCTCLCLGESVKFARRPRGFVNRGSWIKVSRIKISAGRKQRGKSIASREERGNDDENCLGPTIFYRFPRRGRGSSIAIDIDIASVNEDRRPAKATRKSVRARIDFSFEKSSAKRTP